MLYVIAYDISNNSIRNKLARYLEKQGVRLQKSVFSVEKEKWEIKNLIRRMYQITGRKGEILIFRQCKGCMQRAKKISDRDEKSYYIV